MYTGIKSYKLKILALIALIILLAGCVSDANEDFIQGIWYYNDEHLSSVPAESHLSDNWLFERGIFKNAACCFVKVNMQGRYSILESEENSLKLELYDIKGDRGGHSIPPQTTMIITILIDEENDTIKINRAEPYIRITP